MPAYNYTAIGKDGKEKKGSIEAASDEAAKEMLKADGMIPITVVEPNLLTKEIAFDFGKKVTPRELGVFCRQFQSILESGITITAALDMLAQQTENKKFAEVIRDTKIEVEKGETLAGAMSQYPKFYPPILVNMIEAGEATGKLEIAFERMAVQFEKDAHLRAMISKAMVYPCILLLVVVAVVILMMVVIVPSFIGTLGQVGGELPAITRMVVAVSDFLVAYWYYLVIAIAAIVFGVRYYISTDHGALVWGRLMLRMPLFGNLNIKSASAKFTRTLSTLLASGITLVDATELVAKQMTNQVVRKVVEAAKTEVERGTTLSQPIEASGVFPPMVYHMLKIGEETGNIESMLDRVADYYDEEVENATEALTAAMEPLIIVIMALVVVPIMLAILMPMFSIYSAIG